MPSPSHRGAKRILSSRRNLPLHARNSGGLLIGMLHLPPLPGSARAAAAPMDLIIKRALTEARLLERCGFDGLIVENFGDAPFAADEVPPETLAAMAIVVREVVRAVRLPVGVNVLRNDALGALAVAAAAEAAFIRVNVLSGVYATDQGIIVGRARELLDRRASLRPQLLIAGDVHVKHAVPLSQPDIAAAAGETAYRAGADILIVSGPATGQPTDLADVRRVVAAVPDRPVWIGSGATVQTASLALGVAHGIIVGSSLKRGGRTTAPMDPGRARDFVRAARRPQA